MSEVEDQLELQLDNSPPELSEALFEDLSGEGSDCTQSPINSGYRDEEEPLLLLADVALAPPCGGHASSSCLEVKRKESHLPLIQLQLQFFLSKADDLHNRLVSGQNHLETEHLVNAVSHLLYTCQPFFNYLESTARCSILQYSHMPCDVSPKLLDVSQQLCDRLEQLVLTYASYDLLSLDETEPNNTSHFCIGQSQFSQWKLTAFRYCKPTPYLARVNTGLYKRMRWNVEQILDGEDRQDKTGHHTDYYFLCYEDIPNAQAEADQDSQGDNVLRMWSIGQWVQVNPDPNTDDIYDWIMCEVPQASYHRLLFLGHDEPSSCSATDYLQQMLLSHHTD
ncbi:UPF0575 protein C19orf67 homolog [Melanotaenia boesemani]|uniref:UPF0575 protein C19orf67 homolog n=1 Tax=Melanotaenia boesemani TaxID=1250792 RepID=UPI001C03E83D|nr:UPF0575 protein C19orf67 homolog [Melanotaenia boesemani]